MHSNIKTIIIMFNLSVFIKFDLLIKFYHYDPTQYCHI